MAIAARGQPPAARPPARLPRGRRVLAIGLLLILLVGWAAMNRPDTSPIVRSAAVGAPSDGILAVDKQTGRTFVVDQADGTLSVLDTRTGTPLATRDVDQRVSGLAIDQGTGRVIVSGGDQTISLLDGHSGATLHVVTETVGTATRGVAVDPWSAHAFIGHQGAATVTLLDARNGAILTPTLDTCFGPGALAVSMRTHHVFAKCDDGTTATLDARTGSVLAMAPTYGAFGCVRVDEPTDRVFTLSTDTQQVDVLDARTGSHVSTIAGMAAHACPAVDERSGRVYVALDGPGIPGSHASMSHVAVLDGTTGAVLRRITVAANPMAVTVNERTGHVLVVSVGPVRRLGVPVGYGTLSVLDGARGQVLRTVPVGVAPTAIAIDTRAGRAIVFDSASDVDGYGLPMTARPHEAWWPQTLRGLKHQWPWLPLTVAPPPSPPTNASVTTLDLARLDGP